MKKRNIVKSIVFSILALFSTTFASAVQYPSLAEALGEITDIGRGFSINAMYARGGGEFIDAIIYGFVFFMLLYPVFKKKETFAQNTRLLNGLTALISVILSLSLTAWAYTRPTPFQLMISLGPWIGVVFFLGMILLIYFTAKAMKASRPVSLAFALVTMIMLLESPLAEPLLGLIEQNTGMVGQMFLGILGLLRFIAVIALVYWLVIKMVPRMFGRGQKLEKGVEEFKERTEEAAEKKEETAEEASDAEKKLKEMLDDQKKLEESEKKLAEALDKFSSLEAKQNQEVIKDLEKLEKLCNPPHFKSKAQQMSAKLHDITRRSKKIKTYQNQLEQMSERLEQLERQELKILHSQSTLVIDLMKKVNLGHGPVSPGYIKKKDIETAVADEAKIIFTELNTRQAQVYKAEKEIMKMENDFVAALRGAITSLNKGDFMGAQNLLNKAKAIKQTQSITIQNVQKIIAETEDKLKNRFDDTKVVEKLEKEIIGKYRTASSTVP